MRNILNQFKRIQPYVRKGGSTGGTIYVVTILALVGGAAFATVGGKLPSDKAPVGGSQVTLITPAKTEHHNNLQLLSFQGVTAAPVTNCQGSQFNTESEILIGSDPAPGGVVNASGSIRVWVIDEGAPYIAPSAVVDLSTGQITSPGDTTAVDDRTDGQGNYLWTPSLYIVTGQTPKANGAYCDAHTPGCTPHFPNVVKGTFSNIPAADRGGFHHGTPVIGPPIDSYASFQNGPDYLGGAKPSEKYTAEYIWNVSALGLGPGNHLAQFVIHDGDRNLAIDCLNINI